MNLTMILKPKVHTLNIEFKRPMSKFNEFRPRLKSAKNRFQLRRGLKHETLNSILSETNHI